MLCLHADMKKFSLVAAATALVFLVAGSPAGASGGSNSTPTTVATAQPGGSKNGGQGTDAAEVCTGYFGQILREYDGSRYYIHFGATQQCSPYPAEQDLQVFLYRWTSTGWVFADSAHDFSPSAYLISAWHEPYCSSTTATTYRMLAWGHANGVEVSPYPATSQQYTINCFHSA